MENRSARICRYYKAHNQAKRNTSTNLCSRTQPNRQQDSNWRIQAYYQTCATRCDG